MKLMLAMALMTTLFVSCGSSEKEKRPELKATEYTVIETSTGTIGRPEWVQNPEEGDKEKNRNNYRYFINESEHSNKRLAMRSAEARANARIAQEIAQFIKNTFSEATQGGDEEDVSEYMEEQLAQEVQTFIVGAEVIKSFWEKRNYSKEAGADENKKTYYSYALVRMDKDNLAKAVKRSRQKLLSNISAPEVKKKAQDALKDAEQAFNNINKPIVEKED